MQLTRPGDRSRPILLLHAVADVVRNSLFITPALFVLAGAAIAEIAIAFDGDDSVDLNGFVVDFTAEGARSLLAAVISATVTVAGVVFALIALTVQLASSQYSPRVVRSFLRDRFQQLVMGYLAFVFTYSLMVLRKVRGASPDGSEEAEVPVYATAIAVVLAVGVVIAILAAVNRTAHSLQVSELIRSVTDETLGAVEKGAEANSSEANVAHVYGEPPSAAAAVHTGKTGWLQQLSMERLLEHLPEGATLWLLVGPGDFIHEGMRVARVAGSDDVDKAVAAFDRAVVAGDVRTMQQDVAFGIRQLADIALRALSPGVNDPTTAAECVYHLRLVLYKCLLAADAETARARDGKVVVSSRVHQPESLLTLAFEEISVAARPLPATRRLLVDTLRGLADDLADAGVSDYAALIEQRAQRVLHPDDDRLAD